MAQKDTGQSLSDLLETIPNVTDHLFRNAPKAAMTIYSQMMPGDGVRPEFTTWRDEQWAWRNTIAVHDQSYHMNSTHVRGPDALAFTQYLSVNSFKTFEVGAAKQLVCCSPEGYLIGDAILYRMGEDDYMVVGNPATTEWVEYNAEVLDFDVTTESDPMWTLNKAKRREFYRFQVEGPKAWELLEELNGGPLPEIKFFKSAVIKLGDYTARGMRHSMGGMPGLEISGPWDDYRAVKKLLMTAGEKYGLRMVGSIAYFTTVIESGWWAVPVSAVYTGQGTKGYRDWMSAKNASMRMSLGGSLYSENIEDYYLTPYDVNYGHIIKFDHDFIGRAALEKMAEQPQRKKMTLVWDADDVLKVNAGYMDDGDLPTKNMDFPAAHYASYPYDLVTKDGRTVGISIAPAYSANERAWISLAVLDPDVAETGTEVTVTWGEPDGGSSKPTVERHRQIDVKTEVHPWPIHDAVREAYRKQT